MPPRPLDVALALAVHHGAGVVADAIAVGVNEVVALAVTVGIHKLAALACTLACTLTIAYGVALCRDHRVLVLGASANAAPVVSSSSAMATTRARQVKRELRCFISILRR